MANIHSAKSETPADQAERKAAENSTLGLMIRAMGAHAESYMGEPYDLNHAQIFDHETGDSLAHWAAKKDLLPKDFNQWLLCNNEGLTVLEVAVKNQSLPVGFKDFGLTFNSGGEKITVAEYVNKNDIAAYKEDVERFEKQVEKSAAEKKGKAVSV